ncbi:MAG TPA: hypothetical protein VNX68_06310 [Nitrosopumilaceae archaeon]|nr:hypothetical protein [Nitrosopumilaceae archaeon]
MNHSFIAMKTNPLICDKCRYDLLSHSSLAVCEACPNRASCEVFTNYHGVNMLLCSDCYKREAEAYVVKQREIADARMLARESLHPANEKITLSQQADRLIQIKSDFFNAQTVAITDLQVAVENDASIENKNYKVAELIKERILTFDAAIFQKRAELAELESKQKATQVYLNNHALKLQAKERELLKLNSPDYEVDKPKQIKEKAVVIHREDKNIWAMAKNFNIPFELAKRKYEAMMDVAKSISKSQSKETTSAPPIGEHVELPIENQNEVKTEVK